MLNAADASEKAGTIPMSVVSSSKLGDGSSREGALESNLQSGGLFKRGVRA